tara:strand:+ start:423 stop:770 length:348 start_codon:yes stop_codon:yes gene_type:complete
MENLDNNITNISFNNNILNFTFDNNATEQLILNDTNYIKIFDKWFLDTPVFISDKFKKQIKSLNFIKINKDKAKNIQELNIFFSNIENSTKFFNYVRTRKNKIDYDKLKWHEKPK